MSDNSRRGLGSDKIDEQTKHEIQSKGGQASHGGGRGQNQSGQQSQSDQGFGQDQYEDSEGSTGKRGLGAMKEQGRDEEVSEIASLGGQSSHGGGRNEE